VPTVELPPATPFTDQSTLVSPVSVSVNAIVPPDPTAATVGETVTVTGVLFGGGVEELLDELHPVINNASATHPAHTNILDFMDDPLNWTAAVCFGLGKPDKYYPKGSKKL
jgi:hypothetical protein